MPIYVNKKLIEPINFPGGECHVTINPQWIKTDATFVDAFLYSSDDIMRLFLTVDAVKRISPTTHVHLAIPYIPYGRQDKVFNAGEAHGISVFSYLISTLDIYDLSFLDAHSSATELSLAAAGVSVIGGRMPWVGEACEEIIKNMDTIIVCPDAGAFGRAREVYKKKAKAGEYEILHFSKKRDLSSGKIKSICPVNSVGFSTAGKNAIIIDDICDGGRTFIEISKTLKNDFGIVKTYLWVTHGIFSEGLDFLKPHLNHIYCHHTWLSEDKIDTSFLTVTGEKYV